MTFASIAVALPLAALLALAIGWGLSQWGAGATLAALWAFSIGLLIGVATLLSDSPAGIVRAIWPREAVDWLAIASCLLTGVAAFQGRPVLRSRATLVLGILLGIAIASRLLYGSIYLRPAGTSINSLLAIASGGALVGVCWYVELGRASERSQSESLATGAVLLGASATLGMSGSFQYGVIGLLVTLTACATWAVTRDWPWVSQLVILMLLGLGVAFAGLSLVMALALSGAVFLGSCLGRLPSASGTQRYRTWGALGLMGIVTLCVGLTTGQFLKEVKGNNASNGGYETIK